MRIALNYRNVDPNRGGAETYVVDLAKFLSRRGHTVTLVAESVRPETVPLGVHVMQVPVEGWTRAGKTLSFAENSERLLTDYAERFDVTMGFINTWHHDVIIPQGGLRAGSIHHNSLRFRSPVRRGLYKLTKALSLSERNYDGIERRQYDPARNARVVAVSRLVAGHLTKFRGVAPERIHVVYNAIDPERFDVADPAQLRAETREHYGLNDSDHVGLFVGHNFWLKGLAPLLEGLAARTSGSPITLLVSGGGRSGPFRKMVERLGLGDRVRLLGFVPDVKALFHAADFFVSPTYYDPCSLVVMEALACGLPVVTTSCNGAGELITPGREGFVIPTPHHQTELIAALDALTDAEARHEMSAAARELGRRQTFAAHAAKLEQLFEAVAAEKAAQRNSLGGARPHFGGEAAPRSNPLTTSTESERPTR
jgi:UDP-glucose:(heptosyl)LPS alpha-1,3-glucosyltransferase